MKINPKVIIAGYPILKIRDLMRQHEYMSEEIIRYRLKTTQKEAKYVLETLLKQELIEINTDKDANCKYLVSLKGNSLGNAKAVPSISRIKADKLFEEFMQRVLEINKKPKYLYKVTKIILFGSFITDAEFVNDIDIAFELKKKGIDKEKWKVKNEKQVKKAYQKGVRFDSIIDDLFYTRTVVLRYLKSRSPYISLHPMEDGILEVVETKQVFPRKK